MFTAHSANKVSQAVVDEQNESVRQQAFFAMMKRHFDNLPGNAITELSLRGDQGFEMTFEEAPFSFQIGRVPVAAESMTLIASGELGDMNLDLMFYENRILVDSVVDESTQSGGSSGNSDEPIAVLPLLEGLWYCGCEVLSQNNLNDKFNGREPAQEVNPFEWFNREELPAMVTFRIQYEKTSDVIEKKYWLRNKVDIGNIIQQFSSQRNDNRRSTDSNNGGGDQQGGAPTGVNPQIPQGGPAQ